MKRKRISADDDPELKALQEYLALLPDVDLDRWPRFTYKVKGNYIGIIGPSGSDWTPIYPKGSPYRPYEIFKKARECMIENVKAHVPTPEEYKQLYQQLNFHELDLDTMRIHYPGHPADGQVRGKCIVCRKDLTYPPNRGAALQKTFCSDKCKDIRKQKLRLEQGKKSVRSRGTAKSRKQCGACRHLIALHKPGHCLATNCSCRR